MCGRAGPSLARKVKIGVSQTPLPSSGTARQVFRVHDLNPAQNERFSYLKTLLSLVFSVENLGSPKYNVSSKNEQKS